MVSFVTLITADTQGGFSGCKKRGIFLCLSLMPCLSVPTCTCNTIKLDLVFSFPVLRPLLSHMFLHVLLRLYKRELCNQWRCERRVGGGGSPRASVERSETTTAYIDRFAHETCYCGGPRGSSSVWHSSGRKQQAAKTEKRDKRKKEKTLAKLASGSLWCEDWSRRAVQSHL